MSSKSHNMNLLSILLFLVVQIQFWVGAFGYPNAEPGGEEAPPISSKPPDWQSAIRAVLEGGQHVFSHYAPRHQEEVKEQTDFLNYYIWAHHLFNSLKWLSKKQGGRQVKVNWGYDPVFHQKFHEARDNFKQWKETLTMAAHGTEPLSGSPIDILRNYAEAFDMWKRYEIAEQTGLYGLLGDPPIKPDKMTFYINYLEAHKMRKLDEEAVNSGRYGIAWDPQLSGDKLAFYQKYLIAREKWKRHYGMNARNGGPHGQPNGIPGTAYQIYPQPPASAFRYDLAPQIPHSGRHFAPPGMGIHGQPSAPVMVDRYPGPHIPHSGRHFAPPGMGIHGQPSAPVMVDRYPGPQMPLDVNSGRNWPYWQPPTGHHPY